jgi:hypothetical protein
MNVLELIGKWKNDVFTQNLVEDEKVIGVQIYDVKTKKHIATIDFYQNLTPSHVDKIVSTYFEREKKEKQLKDFLKLLTLIVVLYFIYKYFIKKRGQ